MKKKYLKIVTSKSFQILLAIKLKESFECKPEYEIQLDFILRFAQKNQPPSKNILRQAQREGAIPQKFRQIKRIKIFLTQEIYLDSNKSIFKLLYSYLINRRGCASNEFMNAKLNYLVPKILMNYQASLTQKQYLIFRHGYFRS
ncbi:unnamed protein product [Paramecium sonneborni]|uniref:Uncharacterized protein n=1 Tax=Paramecium sonneborni TaxID=65129 RepID=A0A8S1PPE5_9CILI|nr:unnamed protein product [Paramecium sonneborni]